MNELTQGKDGYIVFDESGTCALAYGAAEKWFKTYDEVKKDFAKEHIVARIYGAKP